MSTAGSYHQRVVSPQWLVLASWLANQRKGWVVEAVSMHIIHGLLLSSSVLNNND